MVQAASYKKATCKHEATENEDSQNSIDNETKYLLKIIKELEDKNPLLVNINTTAKQREASSASSEATVVTSRQTVSNTEIRSEVCNDEVATAPELEDIASEQQKEEFEGRFEFQRKQTQKKPDIFCVSEHWLQRNDINSVVLDNYLPISHSSRTEFRGGGTAIFVNSDLTVESLRANTECIEKDCEYCISQFTLNNKHYIVICIYRSPTGNLDLFLSTLDEVLNYVYAPNKYLLVNVDFLVHYDGVFSVTQLMASYGLVSHVKGITRIGPTQGTQLDNMFSNIPDTECSIIKINISDHYGQSLNFTLNSKAPNINYARKRFFAASNIQRFKDLLSSETWNDVSFAYK
ncbi:unnamed protein product [Acanthoscelides obtectus]|uniref:Uncharacterized protein n=1 Tax=Acanthoscelides obtectus TaxID=200917 RepID=A0A9P0LRB0_ACAOB|nr:unnamed protein product [Acanthoscelides obtectus]CAK1620089.1 hypothetical protein AOBTE_LOCUS191 [Acanthoscelides obtectus]